VTARGLVGRPPEALGSELKPRGARPQDRPAAHPIGRRHSLRSNRRATADRVPSRRPHGTCCWDRIRTGGGLWDVNFPALSEHPPVGATPLCFIGVAQERGLWEDWMGRERPCRTGIAEVQGDVQECGVSNGRSMMVNRRSYPSVLVNSWWPMDSACSSGCPPTGHAGRVGRQTST